MNQVLFERLSDVDHRDRRHRPTRDIGRVNVVPSLHRILQLTALISLIHTSLCLGIQRSVPKG